MPALKDAPKSGKKDLLESWKVGCRAFFDIWFQSSAKITSKDPENQKPITPTMNHVQRAIMEAIQWCDDNGLPARLITLKARQVGASTIYVNHAYWRARNTNCNVAILGDDKNTTEKLFKIWRLSATNDAMSQFWGNKPRNPGNPSWMEFDHGSSLFLETANDPRAGQGGMFHVLISSETASYRSSGHSTGEDVFSSIAGCVPRLPKTLIALESTAQGMTGIFYTTYQNAVTFEEFKAGKRGNGYIKFFAPWFEFDDYTFDGRENRQGLSPLEREQVLQTLDDDEHRLIRQFGEKIITPERLAWRRQTLAGPDCGGDIRKLRREYPSSPEEAFQGSGSQFFDQDGLVWQETEHVVPIKNRPRIGDIVVQPSGGARFIQRNDGQGTIRLWEYPTHGESYLIFADWCVGKQAAGSKAERDTNAIGVIRAGRLDPVTRQVTLPRVVAAIMPDDRTPTDIAIERVLGLYKFYGDCIVCPEINNKDNICNQLIAKGVINLWYRGATGANGAPQGEGKTDKTYGFLTTGHRTSAGVQGTRKEILDHMAAMTREQAWICSCPTILHQMKVFIRDEHGRAEAAPGEHDDWVMGPAIGLFCLPAATVYREHRGESVEGRRMRHLFRQRSSGPGV